jgi:hypothetical protein
VTVVIGPYSGVFNVELVQEDIINKKENITTMSNILYYISSSEGGGTSGGNYSI